MSDIAIEPTTNRRRQISASLSIEASRHWQEFCAAEGVSVSALIEALGKDLNERESLLAAVVADARMIDSARRRRRVPQRQS